MEVEYENIRSSFVNICDHTKDVVVAEIREYEFTDDVINGLYGVLSAIKERRCYNPGILVSGSLKAGRSHFLKYIRCCLDREFCQCAVGRFKQAVVERDPLRVLGSKSKVTISDVNDLAEWLYSANIDVIPSHLFHEHNDHGIECRFFLEQLLNEFNRMRGYNNYNPTLAQYFEKVLDEKGKFEEFKQRIDSELGFIWEDDCITLATTELDMILDLGKELVPTLATDIIREKIINREITINLERFASELKAFIDKQIDNYRLIFLIDDFDSVVYQTDTLLSLHLIISDIGALCDRKVWIACTTSQKFISDTRCCNEINDSNRILDKSVILINLNSNETRANIQ